MGRDVHRRDDTTRRASQTSERQDVTKQCRSVSRTPHRPCLYKRRHGIHRRDTCRCRAGCQGITGRDFRTHPRHPRLASVPDLPLRQTPSRLRFPPARRHIRHRALFRRAVAWHRWRHKDRLQTPASLLRRRQRQHRGRRHRLMGGSRTCRCMASGCDSRGTRRTSPHLLPRRQGGPGRHLSHRRQHDRQQCAPPSGIQRHILEQHQRQQGRAPA